jgi:hypothetical protein
MSLAYPVSGDASHGVLQLDLDGQRCGRGACQDSGVDDSDREAAFLAALGNEYFVLQSAASTTVSESSTRASLYVLSLSSTLVALGFVSQSEDAFGPFLAIVLPTLFVLGVFTSVRLVDTGVQNVSYLESMARIRRYWAALTPEASQFFGADPEDEVRAALASLAVSYGPSAELFTIASMVATVNSAVAGTGIALLVNDLQSDDAALTVPVVAGLAAGVVVLAAFLVYQHRRYQRLVPDE